MKYLFIGGATDGERLETGEKQVVTIVQPASGSSRMDRYTYNKRSIRTVTGSMGVHVYAWDGISDSDLLRKLVDGYGQSLR